MTPSSKYTLSVVMIVKNEANNLAISLPPLKDLADEIVILDSGSSDNSEQITKQFGAKWHVNTDWQGFGKQRQLAQSYATGDWILALDADEEITPKLKQSILAVKNTKPDNTVYGIKRLDFIFNQQIDNALWGVKAHWRLYPKHFYYDDNLVHESVVLNNAHTNKANTKKLGGFLHHHTAPTPLFWLKKRLSYAKAWAEDRHKQGKKSKFSKIILNPLWAFIKQYFIDGRFLQGSYGLMYSLFFTQYTFNKYAIFFDLSHNQANAAFLHSTALTKNLQPVDLSDKKSTLSLVMIVKNESKHLSACLQTAKDLADEIVILDSGSSDNSEQIAKQFGAKWHVNTDWQGFGKQRQLAQSYATGDYILVLDADERLDQNLRTAIALVLKQPVQRDKVFAFARINYFCGVPTHLNGWYRDWENRLYANNFAYNDLDVHESVDSKNAAIVKLNGLQHHHTNDDLYHYIDKRIRYAHDWAVDKHRQNKRCSLVGILLRAGFSFMREYIMRGQFLAGRYGLIASVVLMFYTLDKYLILWWLNHTKHKN
ncbi:glucosyltransferase Lgt3 [Moraxella macacae 0408225]|uniref:Glucosyltransferase Lgt3 n=1 Tax=Moraxella macacae 0408225 TaxID=1230338 RepID=L2F5M1_9GAMM|nr:glycosyltransferase family 2 protein [Moraxella macacae]ELA08051.1 glucosyltransferase Lgt3 [Moraxella macacae 0408225]